MGKCTIRIYDENTGELLQKSCSKCGLIKDVSEFHKDKRTSDGLKSNCKSCVKGYYKNNKEAITKQQKEYYESNRESILKRHKEYQKTDKYKDYIKGHRKTDKWKEYHKEYYKEYRKMDKYKKHMKEYYESNRESIREKRKEYYENNKDKKREYREANKEHRKEYMEEYYKNNKESILKQKKEYRQTPEGKAASRRKSHNRRALKKANGGTWTLDEWNQCLVYFDYKDAYTGEPLTTTEMEHVIPISKGGTNNIYNLVPANGPTNRSKGKKDLWEWYSKQPYFSWDRYLKICMWIIKMGGATK